jgi:hypothetical protein
MSGLQLRSKESSASADQSQVRNTKFSLFKANWKLLPQFGAQKVWKYISPLKQISAMMPWRRHMNMYFLHISLRNECSGPEIEESEEDGSYHDLCLYVLTQMWFPYKQHKLLVCVFIYL